MFQIIPQSVQELDGNQYCLIHLGATGEKRLGIRGDLSGFQGEWNADCQALLCPLSPENAVALRTRLPWLRPVPLGARTSFGFGDRLGLATPGHVASVWGTGIAPIFAQQSVRENARTGRTPLQVLDDAMWGLFETGWKEPWGADADHIKAVGDLEPFIEAGYTFYTIDPGDQVDNAAHTDRMGVLLEKVTALPWEELATDFNDLQQRYAGRSFQLADISLTFDRLTLLRAAAKYGHAIAHARVMADHLRRNLPGISFNLEMSVDETHTPTSVHEHFYIAGELRRLGVPFTSLAPRFVGRFEKGVDYIGDLAEFEGDFRHHAAVMRYYGGYKLSIHTGSDKFSLYPVIARHTDGLVHVKTAGTSYLEALRVLAMVEPEAFREILDFARDRYETERASYHVSADLLKVPVEAGLANGDLLGLFEQFGARQVLHVTFGSVLDQYGVLLRKILQNNAALYAQTLQKHFVRHLAAFHRTHIQVKSPL
jgi:hypothetical protein